MKHWLSLLTTLGILLAGSLASAQAQGYYRRPTTSPYLDLLNPGAPFDFNYFRFTRPEIELRNSARRQSEALQQLRQRVQRQEGELGRINEQIGPTGHSATFMDYRGYYNFQTPTGRNFGSR